MRDQQFNLILQRTQNKFSTNNHLRKSSVRYSLSRLKGQLAENRDPSDLVPMSADPVFTHFYPHHFHNHWSQLLDTHILIQPSYIS